MAMPGRTFSAGNQYRYGFNGKENDPSISDGAQDYGMRISDTRLGRFLSVDPLSGKYPELTPYQFASNNPIVNIDLDGLEGVISTTPGQTTPTFQVPQQPAEAWKDYMMIGGFYAGTEGMSNIEYFDPGVTYKTASSGQEICGLNQNITPSGGRSVRSFDYLGDHYASIVTKDDNGQWNWSDYKNSAGKSFINQFYADNSMDFSAEVYGKVTFGIQASLGVTVDDIKLKADANAFSFNVASGSTGWNAMNLNPGNWNAYGYYAGKKGEVKAESSLGLSATANIPGTSMDIGLGGKLQQILTIQNPLLFLTILL